MIIIVFVGFLVFLYCMYFIKNPYFSLNKIKIKRSRYLLISELSMGGIIFFYTLVNDTLRMYKNDDIRMYNFNCITDTIVEVITTCNTYTLLTVHLL